jgi:hypothetical protein
LRPLEPVASSGATSGVADQKPSDSRADAGRGCTPTSTAVVLVSKYETGERRLDIVELLEVMEALSLDPKKLITELITHQSVI